MNAEPSSLRQFVGRAGELQDVADALGEARRAEPVLVLLGGTAGVGKSSLLARACQRASAAGDDVFSGGCSPPRTGEIPYGPLAELLRSGLQAHPATLQDLPEGFAAELGRLLPELPTDDQKADPAGDQGVPGAWRVTRFLAAVNGLLAAWSAVRPTVLAIEDLHWADQASLDWLAALARNLPARRLAVVVTFRQEDATPGSIFGDWIQEQRRLPCARTVELGPLPVGEVSTLVSGLLGHDAGPGSATAGDGETARVFAAAVHDRSGGVPYYVEQLVAARVSTPQGPRLPPALPDALSELLLARVRQAPARARRLLVAACVLARPVDDEVLAGIAGEQSLAAVPDVRLLLERRLLVAHDRGLVAAEHALLAEAVAADLLPSERRQVHAACARELRRQAGHDTAEVARHLDAAGASAEALAWYVQAAAAAEDVFAYADAIRHLERACELWDSVGEQQARRLAGHSQARLLLRAAQLADAVADDETTYRLACQGLALSTVGEEPVVAAHLHARTGQYLTFDLGDPSAGAACMSRAAAIAEHLPPSAEAAEVLLMSAFHWAVQGDLNRQRHLLERALRFAHASGARSCEAHASALLARTDLLGGDPEALTRLRQAAAVLADTPDLERMTFGLSAISDALLVTNHLRDAAEVAMTARTRLHKSRFASHSLGALTANAFTALVELGLWDDAALLVADLPDVEPTSANYLSYILAAYLDVLRGGAEAARQRLSTAMQGRLYMPQAWRELSCLFAEAALWAGRPNLALSQLETAAAQLAGSTDENLCGDLIALLLRARADQAARGHGEVRAAPVPSLTLSGTLPTAAANELMRAAELSRLHGASDPSVWAQAAALWTTLDRPWRAAYSTWRCAEARYAHNPGADITTDLIAVHDTAVRLGAHPLLAAARQLARHAAVPLPSAAPRPSTASGPLTERELQVLELLAHGLTNDQIASRLYLSASTVRVHVAHLTRKLDAHGRAEAVAAGYQRGLL